MSTQKVEAIVRFSALEGVEDALKEAGINGLTVSPVRGFGEYRNFFREDWTQRFARIELFTTRADEIADLIVEAAYKGAAGGLVTEIISLALIWKQSRSDLNVKGALWHIIQTFVGSLLIIVTALVIHFTGFLLIDPILGMAFGFVLLWASWGILRDTMHLLMEGTPDDVDLSDITRALEDIEDIKNIHHIHAWALTSGRYVFSAHLRVQEGADAQSVLRKAYGMLKSDYGFFFSTLQVEQQCLDESGAEEIDITRLQETKGTS